MESHPTSTLQRDGFTIVITTAIQMLLQRLEAVTLRSTSEVHSYLDMA